MFARTPRLLLRPGFPEDAPALAAAIADEAIARNLANVPWPYRMRDAEAFLASPRDPVLPSLLIFERTDGAPRPDRRLRPWPPAVGRGRDGLLDRARRLGPRLRDRSLRALVDIAADARPCRSLEGSHFLDNPASARVLEKLASSRAADRSADELRARRGGPGAADAAGLERVRADDEERWPPRPRPDLAFGGLVERRARVVAGEEVAIVLVPRVKPGRKHLAQGTRMRRNTPGRSHT